MMLLRMTGALTLVALGVACGGGGSATPTTQGATTATTLVYTDPVSGSYQFRRNPTLSTKTHLVLELWGPASALGSGVTIALAATEASVDWGNVTDGDAPRTFVANGTVFDLGAGLPILKATVHGKALVATVAEKGWKNPKSLNGPLVRVALDLKGTALPSGSPIPLAMDSVRSMVLLGDGTLAPMPVAVGTLKAQ